MHQSLGQSHHLYVENFLTALRHVVGSGNERQRIDFALEHEVARRIGTAVGDADLLATRLHLVLQVAKGVHIRAVGATLGTQTLHINLSGHSLALHEETLALYQLATILIDECAAAIDDVLRGLAEAAAAIDISRHRASTLLSEQRLQVVVLADELVACREVEDKVGTR